MKRIIVWHKLVAKRYQVTISMYCNNPICRNDIFLVLAFITLTSIQMGNAYAQADISIASGGTFTVNAGDSVGIITNAGTGQNNGTASALINNGGTTTNTGTITGNSTTNAGSVSNTGTIGSIVSNGGTTTNAGTILGTLEVFGGTFIQNSGGVVVGTSTANGGTLTNSGTLSNLNILGGEFTNESGGFANNITNSSIATNNLGGTITSLINDAGSFQNLGTIGSVVSNGGTITNVGTITGTTHLTNGLLFNNGIINGTTTLSGNAILGGTGTNAGNLIINTGTIAPGNSIGTISTNNVTFGAGAILEIEVNSAGQSDLLQSTGAVNIDNLAGVNVDSLSGTETGETYDPTTTYTIVTAAGGVSGTFGSVNDNFAFLDALLSYDPNNVFLTLSRNDLSFDDISNTSNQAAVGIAIQSLGAGNSVYDSVVSLSTLAAQDAFDLYSGEIHATAISNMVSGNIDKWALSASRLNNFSDSKPVVWSQLLSSNGYFFGDGNSQGTEFDSTGFVVGAESPLMKGWSLGVMFGNEKSNNNIDGLNSHLSSDEYFAGFYTRVHEEGRPFLQLGMDITASDIRTKRHVDVQNLSETLTAEYNSWSTLVFAEAGIEVPINNTTITPSIGVLHMVGALSTFEEIGGAAALSAEDAFITRTFATLGISTNTQTRISDVPAEFYTKGSLVAALNDHIAHREMSFNAGLPLTVEGSTAGSVTGLVEMGVNVDLSDQLLLGLSYAGQFSSGHHSHTFSAKIGGTF